MIYHRHRITQMMNDELEQPCNAPGAVSSQTIQPPTVEFRLATPGDYEFLLSLFASTRSDELAALAWDPAQLQAFVSMQFSAQVKSYEATHPKAENKIIVLNERPIGRMLVDKSGSEFSLVDISILPQYRNGGIGTALIKELLLEAATLAKPVTLYVINYSPAARLYERLGFSPVKSDGLYTEMKWVSRA